MEHSLTIWKRANYVFYFILVIAGIPVSVRELIPLGWFFRKCKRFYLSFQIKMRLLSHSTLYSKELYFRKTKTCLNKFLHLRKRSFSSFLNCLIMNTQSQRPKRRLAHFFANVWIKFVKRNICELFLLA